MTNLLRFLAVSVFLFVNIYSQAGNDVYIFDLNIKANKFTITNPINISNNKGYDNQPCFTPDGKTVLFSSDRVNQQTDIYSYNIKTKELKRLMSTESKEYSPTIMPGTKNFSVVCQGIDNTQKLWQYDLDGKNGKELFNKINPVAYFAWANSKTVIMYILGEGGGLKTASIGSEETQTVCANTGMAVKKVTDKEAVSFIHNEPNKEPMIKIYDANTKEITPLFSPIKGGSDFCWSPDGSVLMLKETKLFKRNPSIDKDWIEIIDFSESVGLKPTRLSVSSKGDKIAVVFNEIIENK